MSIPKKRLIVGMSTVYPDRLGNELLGQGKVYITQRRRATMSETGGRCGSLGTASYGCANGARGERVGATSSGYAEGSRPGRDDATSYGCAEGVTIWKKWARLF